MWQLWVILILAIVAAIEYGRLRIQCNKMQKITSQVINDGPRHMLFLASSRSAYMTKLFQEAFRARKETGLKAYKDEAGKMAVEFDNGDKLIWYGLEERDVEPIENIEYTKVYVFADSALPQESIRASIDKFGLRNYVFYFSLIDEKGVKDDGLEEG